MFSLLILDFILFKYICEKCFKFWYVVLCIFIFSSWYIFRKILVVKWIFVNV